MTHWGARTRQMGTFSVDRENIRVFAGGGAGESGFLHKKRVLPHSFLLFLSSLLFPSPLLVAH